MLFKKRSLWIVLAENTPDSVEIITLSETIHKDRFYFLSLWIVFSIFMDHRFKLRNMQNYHRNKYSRYITYT